MKSKPHIGRLYQLSSSFTTNTGQRQDLRVTMCSTQNNYLKYPGQFTESKLWKNNPQSALQLYPRKRIWLDPGKSCFAVLVLQRSFWRDAWRGRADGGKFMETGVGRLCVLKWGPSSPGTKSNSWGQEPKRILGSFQKCFINKRKESWG